MYKLITIFFLSCLIPFLAAAKDQDYKILVFEAAELSYNQRLLAEDAKKAEERKNRHKKKRNRTSEEEAAPSFSNNIVEDEARITAGKFRIYEEQLKGDRNKRYKIRKYKNNLTQVSDNKWKISVLSSEVSSNKEQEIIQEILRQLNAKAETKNSFYEEVKISGWTVRIQEDLLYDKKLRRRALKELKKQLMKIRNRVPVTAVTHLEKVPIWLYKKKRGVQHNVTAYYTSLYKAVIFHDAQKLHNLSNVQNAVVLHELAHGYHDIILGYDNMEIIDAYENAVEQGLYLNVATQSGATAKKAYALSNHKEYFAEATESYFSKTYGSFENDYFPFHRKELKKYDRTGHDVVKKLWEQ